MKTDEALILFQKNMDIYEKRISEGIEKYRKGSFTVHLSVPVDKISIKQKDHSFKFGCNAFMIDSFKVQEKWKEDQYKALFSSIFNLAVVPFYWSDLEPVEGQPRFSANSEKIYRRPAPDAVLDFCAQYGIEPKGHCLAWNSFNPVWLEKYSEKDRKRLLEKRFREISQRYADIIPSWDIVNESASNYMKGTKSLFYGWDEFALDLGEKYFKNNCNILNETNGALWVDYSHSGNYYPYGCQLEKLLMKNKRFDKIGLQYHIFHKENDMKRAIEWFLDPEVVFGLLDNVNSYGKPVCISEITIPSWFEKNETNRQMQAEVTRFLYRLWFSIENMDSIVWWNLVDGYAAYCEPNSNMGENVYGAGLIDFNMDKKPAYETLDALINHEWKTAHNYGEVQGKLEFRGFYGNYELEIERNNQTIKYEFTIDKESKNRIEV